MSSGRQITSQFSSQPLFLQADCERISQSAASTALAGYLFDHISLSLPFEIGAMLQGINAFLFSPFFRTSPLQKSERRSPDQISSEQAKTVLEPGQKSANQG